MPKNNNLLLIGALGIGALYLFSQKAKAGKRGFVNVEDAQIVKPGSEEWTNQPDAVIDTEKQRLSVQDAVNMAKDIIAQAKDAFVIVKHPKGKVGVRGGRKKLTGSRLKGRKVRTVKASRKMKKMFSKKNTAALTFI